MSDDLCVGCRSALSGTASQKLQAEIVDRDFPACQCEAFAVGAESPGIVQDGEFLYRLIISPGDVDEDGTLLLNALRTAKEDGLSVFREAASDPDITALVVDRLATKVGAPLRTVQGLLRIRTSQIRGLVNADLGRLFCVYDETVPRKEPEAPRVPTHVTVLQRLYPPKSENRKGNIAQTQNILFGLIKDLRVDLSTFRNGLLLDLNERSLKGAFIQRSGVA